MLSRATWNSSTYWAYTRPILNNNTRYVDLACATAIIANTRREYVLSLDLAYTNPLQALLAVFAVLNADKFCIILILS